jgi:hypothetical protein
MQNPALAGRRPVRFLAIAVAAAALAACADQQPMGSSAPDRLAPPPVDAVQAFECTASTTSRTVSCKAPGPNSGASADVLIGGQNTYVKLTSSNVNYSSGTEIFSFDVTVQNLMSEALGTPDGTTLDAQGIQVFFHLGPNVTGGSGSISVANADGTGTFTGTNQPYFAYNQVLLTDSVSAAKTWQLSVPTTVTTFSFTVYVWTEVQYKLVINEVLANPGGTISDASGEWFELYNAGTRSVDLQNLVIADSAASGRRPYHLISSSLVVPSGGYVVLGNTTNATLNGGVPVDYAYGAALALANSLDAIKIARVYGTDTLTLDRTQYASAAISAQNGISRELTNPALDNSNMDGSNWADALVTAVYGPGGRGTPRAQNSTYTP